MGFAAARRPAPAPSALVEERRALLLRKDGNGGRLVTRSALSWRCSPRDPSHRRLSQLHAEQVERFGAPPMPVPTRLPPARSEASPVR